MASEAIRQAVKVAGMDLANPPSSASSVVPVFFSTAPAHRKRQFL